MQIWTNNKAGHWKKRPLIKLQKLANIGLRHYLKTRKLAANGFGTRWIVFSQSEKNLLEKISKLLLDRNANAKSLLTSVIAPYPDMSIMEVSTKSWRLREKMSPSQKLKCKRIAIRIQ